jgi:hypothetical protein
MEMNSMVHRFLDSFAVVFIEISSFVKTEEEHEHHLRVVLETLRKNKIS